MTDKAALLAKIKDRLPPLATQQCKKAPGHLAVFVKRADNQQPLSGVQVNAKGPSSADGVTDEEGWIIFTNRNPGGYRADISLPEKLRTFRLPSATKNGTVPGCGTEILEFDATPPKVGVALSLRAVLFKKDANPVPAASKDFQVLAENEFPAGNHLLADGESQAVIQIELMKLNDKGQSDRDAPLAGSGDHFDEGTVVLELSSAEFGQLSYAGKNGTKISVPVKDISGGKSPLDKDKGIVFTTSRKIGEAKLTAKIENAKSYQYVADFKRLRGSKELTVGSRLAFNSKGYDARKAQWFLRHAGFLAYEESILWKNEKKQNDASCEWTKVTDIDVDGDFGKRSNRCLRDFQRVARGSFRNQTVKQVTPTLTAAMSEQQVTPEVISEFLEWRSKGYKVEPYNGFVHLKVTEGTVLDEKVRIVYGALVVLDGDDAKGYVELKPTIGESVCHWSGRAIVVADEIRSSIKLFEKEVLKFRLHDADPGGPDSGTPVLDDENLNPKLVEKLKPAIRELRREQKAADSGADYRDVRLYEGYRSVARQESLFYKGRYRWPNAQGVLQFKEHTPPAPPLPAGLTHTNGEQCQHGAETIPVGTCLVHRGGNPPGQPCKHGAETRPVGTCAEHKWGIGAQPCNHPAEWRKVGDCYAHPIGHKVTGARGETRSSWHQYGLAVDLVFSDPKDGDASWPKDGNYARNGKAGKDQGLRWAGDWVDDPDPPHIQVPQPPNDAPKKNPHRDKYDATNGSELDKLKAVWLLF